VWVVWVHRRVFREMGWLRDVTYGMMVDSGGVLVVVQSGTHV
jgi:hypothetical protein